MNHYSMATKIAYNNQPYIESNEARNENNYLIFLAMPLLIILIELKVSDEPEDVFKLQQHIVKLITSFEQNAVKLNFHQNVIKAAKYCICAAIDEVIFSKSWGANSIWMQESLLALFHKETWGGERFYQIIDKLSEDIVTYLDFLELAFILLSLGFEGKMYGELANEREQLRNQLFYKIRKNREKPSQKLIITEKDNSDISVKKITLKSLFIIWFLIGFCICCYYNLLLLNQGQSFVTHVRKMAVVSPVTIFEQSSKTLDRK